MTRATTHIPTTPGAITPDVRGPFVAVLGPSRIQPGGDPAVSR